MNAVGSDRKLLLSSREVADMLGFSRATLHRLVKAGKIECIRFAINSVYFTQQQVDEFIERHRKRYAPSSIGNNARMPAGASGNS